MWQGTTLTVASFLFFHMLQMGISSGAVGLGTVPQDGSFCVQFPVGSMEIFK
jgi:hypothetical protein